MTDNFFLIDAPFSLPLLGGMPSPLPESWGTGQQLKQIVADRLSAISFFLLSIFLSTVAVQYLWNTLAKSWHVLPRMSFGRAFAFVLLWGFLFTLVLTMISGARELLTPGAWKRDGATYKLNGDPLAHANSE